MTSVLTNGDTAPNLANYAYSTSGYLGSDASADTLTGSLNGSTSYNAGSNVGAYDISYGSGGLSSALGYGFTYASNASALTVNKATLSLNGGCAYDGSTMAQGSTLTALGVNGESFSMTGTGTLGSKNAGSTTLVSLGTLGLGSGVNGALASNYNAPSSSGSTYTIDKASITVSGITAQNKTYDGNTAASLVTSAATLAGRVGSDDLSVSATGSFDDRNIGRGKTVMLFNLGLQGADASNYTLAASGQQATTSADILQDSQSAAAIPTLPSSAFSKALPQGQLSNSSCREKRHGLLRNKRDDCLETLWIDQKLW